MNLYIDYSEFELTCWNTDGKGTNVAIPLTEEQAKKIRIHGRREFFSSKIDECFDITIIKTNIYSCNITMLM